MKRHKKGIIYSVFAIVIICLIAFLNYDNLNSFLEDKTIVAILITAILCITPIYYLGIKVGASIINRRKK